ncbi:MAG: aminopeptidase [Anaerolineaceae bacterium]|nr:aminopeptidase [Anaerolineaceae bacterium]
MNLTNNLEKYADLIVRIGLNLHKGDNLIIRLTEDALPLARLVAKKAYKAGVGDIQLTFTDDSITLDRFLDAPEESFNSYPEYLVDFMENLLLDNHHVLSLVAPNPDLLKPVDPTRIARWQKVAGMAGKRTMKYTMQNKVKWCVTAVACPAWAKAAFPELSEEEAMRELWKNIFFATRVDQDDPVAAWEEHDTRLKAHQDFLNEARFDRVHYEGPGTDLMVGLAKDHIWVGGSGYSEAGDRFFANIPTEEVFSMPDADRVDGVLRATMPLSVRGQLVDGFHFTFKDGKVVDYDAAVGKQILDDLLATDEGAKHLGEIALVADNSPISNTGVLFKNTLFDENASCHFALGAAYSENLEGSTERSDEENRKLGMNDSVIHVDFMVGSKEVTVTGIKVDGSEVVLLKDGEWTI